jgi:hypothetical protein
VRERRAEKIWEEGERGRKGGEMRREERNGGKKYRITRSGNLFWKKSGRASRKARGKMLQNSEAFLCLKVFTVCNKLHEVNLWKIENDIV